MWTPMSERLPKQGDWDGNGKILIWDVNNGCMIGDAKKRRDMLRPMVTHWRPIPKEWETTLPSAADADVWGCVLVLTLSEGPRVTGWNNPTLNTDEIIGWQRLPAGPKAVEE